MIKIKLWGRICPQASSLVETAIFNLKDSQEPIIVLLNTPGGSLTDAFAICDLLNNITNPVITVAIGLCASAGAMIFNCGKSRYISPHTSYMIHQPMTSMPAGYQNVSDLHYTKSKLSSSLRLYKSYITKGTQIPEDKLKYAFVEGNDLYITAKNCKKYKIATNIFTSWEDLYERENINIDEDETLLFDMLTQITEAEG